MKPGEVPPEIRKRLEADFKAAGIESPTDGQILGAYQRGVMSRRGTY